MWRDRVAPSCANKKKHTPEYTLFCEFHNFTPIEYIYAEAHGRAADRYVVQAPRSATIDKRRPTMKQSDESYFAVNGHNCTNIPTKTMTPPSKGRRAISRRMADGRIADEICPTPEYDKCFVTQNNIGNK